MAKRLIRPTEEFTIELPYSEVCMHLRVAGTRMRARLQPNRMVQLLQPDGTDFSFPITDGEAGLYTDEQGAWLLTAHEEPAEDPPTDPERSPTSTARECCWTPSANRWASPTGTPGAVASSTAPAGRCTGIPTSAT
ncbi:MAG TPA: hypothetical protein VG276_30360 [Actinomycetes bacterium]|nr:hypothetical protein [Actinomycetes bacterium]